MNFGLIFLRQQQQRPFQIMKIVLLHPLHQRR